MKLSHMKLIAHVLSISYGTVFSLNSWHQSYSTVKKTDSTHAMNFIGGVLDKFLATSWTRSRRLTTSGTFLGKYYTVQYATVHISFDML